MVSAAPGTTTWGRPRAPAASSRSGPASCSPPTRWAPTSARVMSTVPWIRPSPTSRSMVLPPTPDAWKIQGSQPAASSSSAVLATPGVVVPYIVRPTTGRPEGA